MKPISGSTKIIHNDRSHHLGIDINHLVMLTKEKSFRMPSGLTREERRAWAKKNQQQV